MSINSRNPFFFVSNIKREENITGFEVRQSFYRAGGGERLTMELLGKPDYRMAWAYPTGLEKLSREFTDVLPPAELLIRHHTLFPLCKPFLPDDVSKRLYQHHLGKGIRGVAAMVGMSTGTERSRLAICPVCVKDDRAKYGFAIWRRLHLMPGISICPSHGAPLMTFCDICETGHRRTLETWHPTLRCVCGGALKPVHRHRTARERDVTTAVAKMSSQLLQGGAGAEFNCREFRRIVDEGLTPERLEGRPSFRGAAEQLADVLGPEAMQALGIRATTALRLSGARQQDGWIRHPVQNIALVFAKFGGWAPFYEVLASLDGEVSACVDTSTSQKDVPMERKVGGRRPYRERMSEKSEDFLAARRESCRLLIRTAMQNNPKLTRRDIVRLEKGVEAYRFVMLFDRAWLDVVLPPLTRQAIADRRAAAFVDSHDARAATLVRRKHERLIDLYPEKKISRSLLLNNVRCETRWPRNRDFPLTEQALAECADTHESWANRQVDMLVPEIARWSTKTPFSRRETFEGLAGGKLTEKIRNARKWLHQHAPR